MVSLKMQATANAKGFTLVELIVVITILAILGTIGFISLQGYSAQSRDSKRTSDLRSLATAVTTKNTEGLGLLSMVGTPQTNLLTTGRTIAGNAAAAVISTAGATQVYTVGEPNTTVLGINAGNFNDPSTSSPYKIGSTTLAGSSFQLAATMEGGGTKTALVTGNYNNRANTAVTLTASSPTGATTFAVPAASAGFFKKDDIIAATPSGNLAAGTKIVAVSSDGLTVTTNNAVITGPVTAIALAATEQAGLIGTTAGTAAVTNNQSTNLPY